MSGEKNKLEALFEEALAGQEKLQSDVTPDPDSAAAAEAEIAFVEDEDAVPAPAPAAAATPAAAPPPKRTAAEALTEALIKAKQEALQALEQTQTEAKSLHDRLLRVSADFDNFRKRSKKQSEDAIKFANEGLLRELLPGLDAFDRALQAIAADDKSALAQGIQMVHRMFEQTFQRIGLQSFSAVGQAFDPNRHEAVEQMTTTEYPAGVVVREYQKGFLLHERLLRPATVVVALAPPAAEPVAEPPAELAADALQPPPDTDPGAVPAAAAPNAAATEPAAESDEKTPG